MNLPQEFAVIRTKSGREHLVTQSVGDRVSRVWMRPIEDIIVSQEIEKVCGSRLEILTDEIESIEFMTADEARSDIQLEARRLYGQTPA